MAPPSVTSIEAHTNPYSTPSTKAPLEVGLSHEKGIVQKGKIPQPPKFEDKYEERDYLKGRLAAGFRIFAKHGFDEGLAGHITVRDPVDPHTFWVNPLGIPFVLIKKSDLIRVNDEGEVVDGGSFRLLNTAAFAIHSAIHKARPDVMCAAHSHSIYGKSFCALGRNLDMITQDACAFYQDVVLYENFNGIVLAEEEGANIATCLGNKKAALLQNHGLLTVGETVEAAVHWYIKLERCCHSQLLADAAATGRGGATIKIGDAEAEYTHKIIGGPLAGWFSGKATQFDVIEKELGADYLH